VTEPLWAAEAPATGAIGAACEVPETAVINKATTANAKAVRIIIVLLRREPLPAHNAQKLWQFHYSVDSI
jgi:hypothetical protein